MDFSETVANFVIWFKGDVSEENSSIITFIRNEETKNGNLWHFGEGPCIFPAKNENLQVGPGVEGFLRYGENVEDEWWLVFLLLEISEQHPDYVIKIWDADGEFLLVEAADHLPRWANPDTTENRVFIHKGKLHLIPIAVKPSDVSPLPKGTPSLMDSVNAVRNYPEITVAPPDVQQAIRDRVKGFPEKLNKNLHRCQCFLPANAAALLKSYPTMVAPAVIAFCHRDENDSKACRAMKFFPPETRVMTSVLMTRHHYAMLTSQTYTPDKRTGWTLPPSTDLRWKSYDLGLKLACGFEILLSHVGKSDGESQENDAASNPKWDKYVRSLAEKGYFQSYMEGSKPYRSLLDKAKVYFEASVTENSEEFQASYKHHMGRQLQGLLKQLDVDYDSLKAQERSLLPSDDDSWMNVTPEQLDTMLAEKMQQNATATEDLSESLTAFMEKMSSYEGVEQGGRKPSVPPRKKSSTPRKASLQVPQSRKVSSMSVASTSSNISALTDKLGFDADGFAVAMQNILDFGVPEDESFASSDDSDSSGLSDYGSEPELDFSLQSGEAQKSMKNLMDSMERELIGSGVMQGRSDVNEAASRKDSNVSQSSDDNVEFNPVSIDASALNGLLEAYRSQHGLPGPASSLLGSMGVQIERLAANKKGE